MSGTREGGLKAAQKNRERDPDFYKKIGSKGGKKTGPKGFAYDDRSWFDKLKGVPSRAQLAGRKGGKVSKRTKEY